MRLEKWPKVARDEIPEPDEDQPLQDFDETVSADFESTRHNLVAMPDRAQEVVFRRQTQEAILQLADECKELRRVLAKTVKTVNIKASKGQLAKLREDLEKERQVRTELMLKWIAVLAAVAGSAVALVKGLK